MSKVLHSAALNDASSIIFPIADSHGRGDGPGLMVTELSASPSQNYVSLFPRPRGLHSGGGARAAGAGRRGAGPLRGRRGAESDPDRQQADEALQRALSGVHQ